MLKLWRQIAQSYGFWILVVPHFFGVLVMAWVDLDYFARFTPLNLILSALLIIGVEHEKQLPRLASFFALSFSLGFAVEVLGTQTGFPFGNYWYLQNLGPKLWEVPVLIGLNWFLLAYSAGRWARGLFSGIWMQASFAAALMVGLDFFIEPLSQTLGFWAWEGNTIPWQNYLAWFVVAFSMQLAFVKMPLNKDNYLARWYFPIIASFFILLNLFI